MPRPHPGIHRGQPVVTRTISYRGSANFHFANIKMQQELTNETNRHIEATYLLAIPPAMTIQDFSLTVNGKKMHAELLDSDKAKKLYEKLISRWIDPALAQYAGASFIRLNVFPFAPHETHTVELEFRTHITREDGMYRLELPAPNNNIRHLNLDLQIETQEPIGIVRSPTLPTDIAFQAPNRARISAEGKDLTLARPVRIDFKPRQEDISAYVQVYTDPAGEHYFDLSISPGFPDTNRIIAKDVIFALDVSGSMRGEKLQQAKQALKYCLEHLNPADSFNIIRFATEANALSPTIQAASPKNIRQAILWLQNLKAAGGTNIHDALQTALAHHPHDGRPAMVLFITDGRPTIGKTETKSIIKLTKQAPDRPRVFTFGLGNDVNVELLDKITEVSNGYRTYVAANEPVDLPITSLYQKLSAPVLANPEISPIAGLQFSETYPKRLPDLFRGSTLTLLGKYNGTKDFDVRLTAQLNGRTQTYTYHLKAVPKPDNDYIPGLWATRKVAYLYDQIRLNGEDKELRDELIATAKKYGIITPYTSLLIIDENDLSGIFPGPPGGTPPPPPPPVMPQPYKLKQRSDISQAQAASMAIQAHRRADALPAHAPRPSVQFVRGRAFYLIKDTWVDAYLQNDDTDRPVRKFKRDSGLYRKLLQNANTRAYLLLGPKVRFLHEGVVYELSD